MIFGGQWVYFLIFSAVQLIFNAKSIKIICYYSWRTSTLTGERSFTIYRLAVGPLSASALPSEPVLSEQHGNSFFIQGYLHLGSQHLGSSSQGTTYQIQELGQVAYYLFSVIFCEAVAIYGVIMAIILQGKIGDQCSQCQDFSQCAFAGYALFWTGISVGFSNLFCG